MDPNQVLEFKKVTEEYLEKHNIFKLFQELIEGLVVSKPKDPINYLMSRISEEEAYTFFFIAPPGSGVSNLLKEICTEKTGTYLNFGEHILREISEETDFGKEVSTSFKERKLHINEKTQDAFYEAFEGCQKNGKDIWVEGYPKTKLQALNMRNKKILPDLIMIVNKNRADCIRNLVETAFKDLDETTALQKANDSLDEYYLYLQGVKQIYQSNIQECDLDNSDKFKYFINRIHSYTTYKTAPKRSPRILLVGPTGSGKTTISKMISQKFNFAEILFPQLLREHQKINNGENEISKPIREAMAQGEQVDAELVNMIMAQRFSVKDIHILGCVLDGYPKTPEQTSFMEDQLGILPSHIFVLNADSSSIAKRVGDRMQDPKTMEKYSRNQLEKLDRGLLERLIEIPEETPENMQKRNARWNTLEAHLREKHTDILYDLDANMTPENIVEKISFYLEKQK